MCHFLRLPKTRKRLWDGSELIGGKKPKFSQICCPQMMESSLKPAKKGSHPDAILEDPKKSQTLSIALEFGSLKKTYQKTVDQLQRASLGLGIQRKKKGLPEVTLEEVDPKGLLAEAMFQEGVPPLICRPTVQWWGSSMERTLVRIGFYGLCLYSAWTAPISDCDEVYNYWEPIHFVLHGYGLQTWEYAPQYALRSYAYLLPFLAILMPMKLAGLCRVTQFYLLRLVCALCTALATDHLSESVRRTFGSRASLYFRILMCSPGMFISASSILPQAFVMVFVMLAYSFWLRNQLYRVILCFGIACLIGWPFAAFLALPLGLYLVPRLGLIHTVLFSLFVSMLLLGSSVLVDLVAYRKFVVAILNIVIYNRVQMSDGSGGADIYGTEPLSYYLINCILNVNVSFILTALFPVIMLSYFLYVKITGYDLEKNFFSSRLWLLMPMLCFIIVFFSMSHKEERFLFPVYPVMSLIAALALEVVSRFMHHKKHMIRIISRGFLAFALLSALFLSTARAASLVVNYSSPFVIYRLVSQQNARSTVCVGKEWHRFPSSFFLPGEGNSSRILFLESGFRGQLPKEFKNTYDYVSEMNDRNKEESARYSALSECHLIVDFIETESSYSAFDVIFQEPFLDSRSSPSPYRSFYIPFISKPMVSFKPYVLLRRRHV